MSNDLNKIREDIRFFLKGLSKRGDFFLTWFPKDGTDPRFCAEYDCLVVVAGVCHLIRIITPFAKAMIEQQETMAVVKAKWDSRTVASGARFIDITNDIDAINYLKTILGV